MNEFIIENIIVIIYRGFINIFSRKATCFYRQAKQFDLLIIMFNKNIPLDGQTGRPKSSPQMFKLPSVHPLMKPKARHILRVNKFDNNFI